MLTIVLVYGGIGSMLALAMFCRERFRQRLDHLADSFGIGRSYARSVWLSGTLIAWPVGLYVATTGRLLFAASEISIPVAQARKPMLFEKQASSFTQPLRIIDR